MRVIEARNVHSALPLALDLLDWHGVERNSRNGKVRQAPWPVTTVYTRPMERVIFWSERDANPFFHLYEALWMLQGRNDVAPLVRYAKQIAEYSDDGETFWGAYGHRWRHNRDQLAVIARRLQANPEDRRCVLAIWDADRDLDHPGKDVPCNTTATFQRNDKGELELTVFNRSNDIIWGAYGANAVHLSLLQEYLAIWIGCPIGVYRQVSVNWHGYLNTLERVTLLPRNSPSSPYDFGKVRWLPMSRHLGDEAIREIDNLTLRVMSDADAGFKRMYTPLGNPFFDMVYHVLFAHHCYKTLSAPEKFTRALSVLQQIPEEIDWKVAAREWIQRRKVKYDSGTMRILHPNEQ